MKDAQIQSFNNVITALRHLGLYGFIRSTGTVQQDRVLMECSPQIAAALDARADFGRWPYFKNHGADAYASWRENVTICSMQVTLHERLCGASIHEATVTEAEIDFDLGRPGRDLVGWLVHGWECAANAVTRGKTNPFRVMTLLNGRGYGIVDVRRKEEA